MRHKIIIMMALFMALCLKGIAEVKFTANAPQTVVQGEKFRVTFEVNTQNIESFEAPAFSGFEVLFGPSQSSSTSVSYINGKRTDYSSVSLSYTLYAAKTGSFAINGANAVIDGKRMTSNKLNIKVLPADKASSRSQNNNAQQSQSMSAQRHAATTTQPITGKDLFITVSASKHSVYEQEAVLLTYKVFTAVDLTSLDNKTPELQNVHIQEIPLPLQKHFSLEHYNGRNYQTVVWRQYLIYPQQPGVIEIPSITFKGTVVQRTQYVDPIDAFFNGGGMATEVSKQITAPAIKINVNPLPQPKPADFSGAVGSFTMRSSINTDHVKANDPVTLKVTVTGNGNLKLMKAPVVNFPKDFETYDPKVQENTKTTTAGVNGTKTYEFLSVPRHEGDYTIPAAQFTYFDLASKSYKTIQTEAYPLHVAKGSGNAQMVQTSKEELKKLADDIRYIKLSDVKPEDVKPHQTEDGKWQLSYLYMLVGFAALYFFLRKVLHSFGAEGDKGKRANKVAVKRLKAAAKLMKEQKTGAFYDEVLKAMWGYLSDKFGIPLAELTKTTVAEKLLERGVSQELIEQLREVLDTCEFARYASSQSSASLNDVYAKCLQVISEMESQIK